MLLDSLEQATERRVDEYQLMQAENGEEDESELRQSASTSIERLRLQLEDSEEYLWQDCYQRVQDHVRSEHFLLALRDENAVFFADTLVFSIASWNELKPEEVQDQVLDEAVDYDESLGQAVLVAIEVHHVILHATAAALPLVQHNVVVSMGRSGRLEVVVTEGVVEQPRVVVVIIPGFFIVCEVWHRYVTGDVRSAGSHETIVLSEHRQPDTVVADPPIADCLCILLLLTLHAGISIGAGFHYVLLVFVVAERARTKRGRAAELDSVELSHQLPGQFSHFRALRGAAWAALRLPETLRDAESAKVDLAGVARHGLSQELGADEALEKRGNCGLATFLDLSEGDLEQLIDVLRA